MKVFSGVVGKALLGAAVGALALGAAQAQDMQEINVISPNDATCSVYPQFVAQGLGYWEAEGLKANLLPSETTIPFVAFLQNGDADLVMLDSAQVLQAADAGLPIKVVYEAYNFAPEGIVVAADSPIQGLSDLKDVTIGMASDRDLITTIISMDSVGTTLEDNNITTVVVGDSGPVMAGALRDGTTTSPPLSSMHSRAVRPTVRASRPPAWPFATSRRRKCRAIRATRGPHGPRPWKTSVKSSASSCADGQWPNMVVLSTPSSRLRSAASLSPSSSRMSPSGSG
jgi:hypothetical protein